MTGRILGPGRYGLAQLRIGDMIETEQRRLTEADIDAFADLTGDCFEIHMDKAAAERHGFRDRVAHGLLVLSVVDGLKNQTPAQFAAIASLGWDWSFKAPVYAKDTLGATITVAALRPTSDGVRGVVTLEIDVRNQEGVTVHRGTNLLMLRL